MPASHVAEEASAFYHVTDEPLLDYLSVIRSTTPASTPTRPMDIRSSNDQ